ncbi:solute carrier family 40 member 2, chloroplastic-like [Typha latifolia]|uniref:solute carrier family 40 member 2, chloroplastic-like n=1 Tax=Typha latifolia TaxID=4733 RepID=UPI003C2E7CA7
MAASKILSHPSSPSLLRFSSATSSLLRHRRRILLALPKPPGAATRRSGKFISNCSVPNNVIEADCLLTKNDVQEDCAEHPAECSMPFVHLSSDILQSELSLLTEEASTTALLTILPVLTQEEQDALAATPAHPTGLYVLYASCFAGNLTEQLWNFTWPAAIAMLHPSLLPVAAVGFFTKLAIFIGGPLIGNLMDSFPRIPAYHYLNLVQTAAQLLSAMMIICAFSPLHHTSASALILQPWFVVLIIATTIDRLASLALGVTMERDWVVLLAGTNRPIALAQANATLSRVDLLCETAGASLFAIFLSKYDPVTCIKLSCALSICTLPVMVFLGKLINQISSGVLERYTFQQSCENTLRSNFLLDPRKIVEDGLTAIRQGWTEYKNQPVLPASLAYVLLCFNIALSPGALMTTFLMHHGISPSIVGGFSGLSALMGILATFISARLVKKHGLLKAGAAGLITQALLLTTAVAVYWSGPVSRKSSLLLFLVLIVLSRLGHMAYSVIGLQILQTGIPVAKVNLIGATELSLASLAEFVMLGVAIIANDVTHFGVLAILSVSSVVAAAWLFCNWLANPTDEQRTFFNFDPQF